MQPIMRIVLPVIGALIGAGMWSPTTRTFDLLVGAFLGFVIADLGVIRARLDALGKEIDRLATEFRRRQEVPTIPAARPESTPELRRPVEFPQHLRPDESGPAVLPNRPWQGFEPSHQSEEPQPVVPPSRSVRSKSMTARHRPRPAIRTM
jgi:hypothetical protein